MELELINLELINFMWNWNWPRGIGIDKTELTPLSALGRLKTNFILNHRTNRWCGCFIGFGRDYFIWLINVDKSILYSTLLNLNCSCVLYI